MSVCGEGGESRGLVERFQNQTDLEGYIQFRPRKFDWIGKNHQATKAEANTIRKEQALMSEPRSPRYFDFILLPLFYYFGAKVGVSLTVAPEGIAILWPPNSILLAIAIYFQGRRFMLFATLAIGAEIAADLPTFRFSEALLFGLTNVLEVSIVFALLTRQKFNPRFAELSDMIKFVLSGPLIGSFVTACFGASIYSYYRGGETGYFEFLRIWWFGNALGLMIITPLLLSLWFYSGGEKPMPVAPRLYDWIAGLMSLAIMGLFIASHGGKFSGVHVGPVLLLPFVIFVATRFSFGWASLAVAAVALTVIIMVTGERNPFGTLMPHDAVVRAQEFIFIASSMSMGLSALLSQIRAKQREIERANAEVVALNAGLEARVKDRTRELEEALTQVKHLQGLLPICAWCKKIRDDKDYWHSVEEYITERTEARFSHGICPECYEKQTGELIDSDLEAG